MTREEENNYWDYLKVDQLLTLQAPQTICPDEQTFIICHQITELYFKLILQELHQIQEQKDRDVKFFQHKIKNVIRYFEGILTTLETIQVIDKEQFLEFRKVLGQASGFQSFQFRCIELTFTSLDSLCIYSNQVEEKYQNLYWYVAAQENSKSAKTLANFETKYKNVLLEHIEYCRDKNIYVLYQKLEDSIEKTQLKQLLRTLDWLFNQEWTKLHFRIVSQYLNINNKVNASTGGLKWQKYLNPKERQHCFFPILWTETEREKWGDLTKNEL